MKNRRLLKAIIVLSVLVLAISVCIIPMSAAEYITGDMNGDGEVDSDDAIYLLRHVLLPEKYPVSQATDMNNDMKTTTDDAIHLLRHTIEPETYPIVCVHNLIEHEAKAATCTEVDYGEYVTCSRCNYTIYNEIPKLGHDKIYHEAKAPTCTEKGWNAYITCSRCEYTTYKEIELLGHNLVDGICSRCNKAYSEGLVYTSNGDGTCYVSGIGTCTDINISILDISPEREWVTSIGSRAFSGSDLLTSVTIPDSVTSIGSSAFRVCDSLTSVTIGNSIKSIEDYAFYGCYKLVEVINKSSLNITKGSSSYGYVAYYTFEVHDGDSKIVNNDGYLLYTYNGVNYLLGYVGSEIELVLPESYNGQDYKINKYAFYKCSRLTSVTIGDSITSIGDYAFNCCRNLTSVTIGDSVTSIGDYAFNYCRNLTSVTIPDSVTSIGEGAFAFCESLIDMTIPNGVTCIGNSAFFDCASLTSVTIGDSVTSIGGLAFYSCDSLTSIVFEDTSTWYRTNDYYDWQNMTGGTETDVTNSSTNATNFKSTYDDYYWYKK